MEFKNRRVFCKVAFNRGVMYVCTVYCIDMQKCGVTCHGKLFPVCVCVYNLSFILEATPLIRLYTLPGGEPIIKAQTAFLAILMLLKEEKVEILEQKIE